MTTVNSIVKLLSINGTEITEHNRKFSKSETIASDPVSLDTGKNKRYIKKNKQTFSINFSYLPNASSKTVDARAGRDFLKTLATLRAKATVLIQLDPLIEAKTYSMYVTSYSETLIKRDVTNECDYYDVSISLEES